MYRANELPPANRNLYRFVWRSDPDDTLKDIQMTRVTFGVASSSFVANMCVKHNASDFAQSYPLATSVVNDSFYVNHCFTGTDIVKQAIKVPTQLNKPSKHTNSYKKCFPKLSFCFASGI